MIQSILLATDGSTHADRAADVAAALALRFGAGLTVLHAYGPPLRHSEPAGAPASSDQVAEGAQTLVASLASRLRGLGIATLDTKVVEGPAVNVIVGVAESCHPDMLIIGARGWSTWQGQGLGSVSMAVLLRAECPVLVVK
jgi:nucleotide-binding universal stress UspA family protein